VGLGIGILCRAGGVIRRLGTAGRRDSRQTAPLLKRLQTRLEE